jgi:hypothetical protein
MGQRATFDPTGYGRLFQGGRDQRYLGHQNFGTSTLVTRRTMKDSQRPSLFTNLRFLILDKVQGFGLNLYTRNGYHLCQGRIAPTRPMSELL